MKKLLLSLVLLVFFGLIYALWSFSSFLFIIPQLSNLTKENSTIVITLHNDAEIRPNLGFLTAFVLLKNTEGGWKMEFHDSYDIEPPKNAVLAPRIIEDTFSRDSRYQGFVFRDSNFFWDFSRNTKEALSFFQHDNRYKDLNLTAVVSLDMYGVGKIIDSVGGVDFNGERITSQNLFSVLENDVKDFERGDEQEWLARKNGMKPLAQSLLKSIAVEFWNWKSVGDTAKELMDEKHIMLHSPDENIQEKWREKNWTGEIILENEEAIFPENHLVWGINFANMGGKKGDRYIDKSLRSTFSLDEEGNITERIRISIDHEGTRNLHSDRYFGYVRLLRPKGTVALKYEGDFLEEPKQVDKNVSEFPNQQEFDLFFWVDESNNTVLDITFIYPQSYKFIDEVSKSMHIISQPGLQSLPVSFAFQGFADEQFLVEGCEKTKTTENVTKCEFSLPFSNTLEKSSSLKITQTKDNSHPLFEDVIYLDEGAQVRVQFSEELQEINIQDIIFTDISGKELAIEKVENDTRAIVIFLEEKLPVSPRSFYQFHLRKLSDIAGNAKKEYSVDIAYPKYK